MLLVTQIKNILESLSENFALNREDGLHSNSFKTIMRFQQKGKSLIEIAKETPKDYTIKQFHGAGKTYFLICRHEKIVSPKQIHKSLLEWYYPMLRQELACNSSHFGFIVVGGCFCCLICTFDCTQNIVNPLPQL